MGEIVIAIIMFVCGIAVGYGLTHTNEDECPREIMGYQCRYGDRCDHSLEAVAKAKATRDLLAEQVAEARNAELASFASELLGEEIKSSDIGGKK